ARFCPECGSQLAEAAPERFRRTVTILFSDIVGSSALGEQLDPETLSRVMSEYFAAVKPAVERHGGRLAKFIGDAVMAVFGLTKPSRRAPRRPRARARDAAGGVSPRGRADAVSARDPGRGGGRRQVEARARARFGSRGRGDRTPGALPAVWRGNHVLAARAD